ncbi:MAG: hypothetical protein PVSMB7_20760 [Chloroflexota bacterium]
MSIPFRSFAVEEAGLAAYLRILSTLGDDGQTHGALLVVNAIGEPVEFCFAALQPPTGALWRPEDLSRRTAATLTRALFEECGAQPRLLLGLASEISSVLFRLDVSPAIAACRVIPGNPPDISEGEMATDQGPRLIWAGERPGLDSPERQLLNRLINNDLLTEPFIRAEAALAESMRAGVT